MASNDITQVQSHIALMSMFVHSALGHIAALIWTASIHKRLLRVDCDRTKTIVGNSQHVAENSVSYAGV